MINKKHLSLGTIKKTAIAGLLALIIGCQSPYIPPPAPPTPSDTNELSTDTHVLSGDEDAKISSVSDNYITTSNPSSYSVGEIIVSDITDQTPDGLLRKVTSVSGNTVYTEPATLEEAVKNVSFEAQKSIISSSSSKRRTDSAKSLTLIDFNKDIKNFIVYDLDGNSDPTGNVVLLNGNISFKSDLDLKLQISNNHLQQFAFYNTSSDSVLLKLTSNIERPDINIKKSFKKFPLSSFPIGYLPTTPPLPIIVKPVIEIIGGLEGNVSIQEGTQISQNATLQIGLEYNNGVWSPIKNFSNNFNFQEPTVSSINSIKAYVGPTISFLLYGVAGPYVGLDAYLRLESDYDSLGLYAGLESIIGVKGKVLGVTLADYFTQLFSTEKQVYSWTKPVPPPPVTTTVDIQPGPEGKDAYILGYLYPNNSSYFQEYDNDSLEVENSGNTISEAYIQFPLDSIPSNANIVSSKIKLYYGSSSQADESINVKKINGPWKEVNADGVTRISSTSQIYSTFNLTNKNQWYECDITPLVKEWWQSGENYGLALTAGSYSQYSYHKFYSSDNADSPNRPILEVEYTTP